jgi:hypothetical protein
MRSDKLDAEKTGITLTREDWKEIYAALDSKQYSLHGDNALEQVSHLQEIMDTIGPDGETAAEKGVEAL